MAPHPRRTLLLDGLRLYQSDPRLIVLGLTGVTASLLMLTRIHQARRSLATPVGDALRTG